MTCPKVSVIVPFFQRKSGILEKAVLSALRQKDVDNCEIIVIDDGSPIAARQELRKLLEAHGDRIRIIEQANMGPALARNNGLDSVSPDTEYVAFLDSDDEWVDTHLENALYALEKGYDFYFADFNIFSYEQSCFIKTRLLETTKHSVIEKSRKLFVFNEDAFDIFLFRAIPKTSTVVYRYRNYPSLRCHKDLYMFDEVLLWLDIAKRRANIVFSTIVECDCGRGVNIYEALEWGSSEALKVAFCKMKYSKYITRHFKLTLDQKSLFKKWIHAARYNFTMILAHDIMHAAKIDPKILWKEAMVDPMTYICFLPSIIMAYIHKLSHRLIQEKTNGRKNNI